MKLRSLRTLLLLPALLAAGGTPAWSAQSILVDLATERVIEGEAPLQRAYPASLTKLMTAYVAFRAVAAGEVTLQSPVRISKKAAALPPSKMGYKPGSELTLDNAIKIIMVKSANDVAYAIGESIAGSEEAFAARMNAESRRLFMLDSNWVNQHGLHDPRQFTSPHDLAVLALAIKREFPQYAGYFSLEGLAVDGKELPTHNNLIGRYDGADGMKTGYTCAAGFNLVASATRAGRSVLAVVVGGETVEARDNKVAELLDKGFAAPGGTIPLSEMRSATASGPEDLTQKLCSKEARAAKAKAWKEQEKLIKQGKAERQIPTYQIPFLRPRKLVAVALGGATGPMSKAMAEAVVYADVPIPVWRPDRPEPFARDMSEGDTSAAN